MAKRPKSSGGTIQPRSAASLLSDNLPPAGLSPAQWVLWVNGRSNLQVYPPAWAARGVDLARMRFAVSAKPLLDLRPAFMEPFFKLIVLDAPRSLSDDDCGFLARRARAQGQTIIVIRDAPLSPKRGNVWARLRVNCLADQAARHVQLSIVRGLSPRQLAVDLNRLFPEESTR